MLPFFRKIRWRLARDNQFLKYSRYAIGEIVLVVLGILIALYINNWNEERKNEKKILEILTEVQRDVLSSIESIERIIPSQSTQDSILNAVMVDTLEVNDLIEHPELVLPIGYYSHPTIVTEGFEKLRSNQDDVPKKFTELYDSIKRVFIVYENNMSQAAIFVAYVDKIGLKTSDEWKESSRVFVDGELNEETLDYLINNPIYRNRINDAYHTLNDQNWIRARSYSYDIYKQIARFTGEDNLPEEYSNLFNTNLDEYTGVYKLRDSSGVDGPSDRIITSVDGGLNYHYDGYIIYQIKKDSFAYYYNDTLFFKRDSSDQIIGAMRYTQGKYFELVKVE